MTWLCAIEDTRCDGRDGLSMMRNRWLVVWVSFAVLWGLGSPLAWAEPIDEYNSAISFYEMKRWEFAVKGFEKFLQDSPTHPKAPLAQLYLGQSLTHSQKYEEARAVFRKFLAAHMQHRDAALAAYRIGESSYFLTDYPAASTELESFVKTYPNHDLAVWGWQYLGEARLQLNDANGAVQAFEVVLKLKTDVTEQVETKFYLARAYEALQQPDKATALLKEVAASDHPRAAEVLFGMASTEYEANRFESAATGFEDLTTRFPKHTLVATAELNAGFSRYHFRDFPGAEAHFERATQSPATKLTATFWKGMCRKSSDDWAGAIEIFEALASKVQPGELAEKNAYHWADSELHRNRYAEAQKLFLSLFEKWPNSIYADDSLYSAADSALRGKQTAEAIRLAELFQTRFELSPLRPLGEMLLGRALVSRGDETRATELEKAQADFQRATQLFRNVVTTSTVSRTVMQSRILWARAEKRLNHPDRVIEALTPVAEAIEKGQPGSADYADALPMLGEALLDVGKIGETETVLMQALKSLPATTDRRPTLVKLAELRAVQGHWPQLEETLDQLAKVDTNGALLGQSAYDNSERAISKKEWVAAQKLLERVVALGEGNSNYVLALAGLGSVQAEQGQHVLGAETYRILLNMQTADATTEVLSKAAFNLGFCLERDAGSDEIKLALASEAFAAGANRFAIQKDNLTPSAADYKAAMEACKCARRAAAIEVKLKHLEKADALWQLAYDQILKLSPADQEREQPDALLFEWAANQLNAGDATRADTLFTKLYETSPTSEFADDARLYVTEGHIQGNRAAAARSLLSILVEDPQTALDVRRKALMSWMNFEAELLNWSESQRIAEIVIKSFGNTPDAFEARLRVGEAQVQRGDFNNAAQTLTDLRSDPSLPMVKWKPQMEMFWAESQLGLKGSVLEYESVRKPLEALVADTSDPVIADQADEILGRIDIREAKFADARAHFERVTHSAASAKSELAAKAQFAIAESYLAQLDYQNAIPAYNLVYTAYAWPEFQAPALLQMAACDMALNEWDSAKSTLETLIKEFPQSQQFQQATQDLQIVQKKLPASTTP